MAEYESVRLRWQPWEKEYGVVVQTAPLSLATRISRERYFSTFDLPYLTQLPKGAIWNFAIVDVERSIRTVSPDLPLRGSLDWTVRLSWSIRCAHVLLVLSWLDGIGVSYRAQGKIPFFYNRMINEVRVDTLNPAFALRKKILLKAYGQ